MNDILTSTSDTQNRAQMRAERRQLERAQLLERLSPREVEIFKEVALGAYVMGMLHVDPTLSYNPDKIPDDDDMVKAVTDNVLQFPDIYPLLSGWGDDDDDTPETSDQ